MINPPPEVLAPAGSPEQLTAAVRSGADAVYLGAGNFNARRSAANFSDDELAQAVEYCHERGVAVYLAMNTLAHDDEFGDVIKLAELACRLSVDGVIVQDMGVAELLRQAAPGLPLHASTQMTVHTPAAVSALEKLGFVRVVLARELSADEIKEIKDQTSAQLEVFVHGALCMSVSGQCYLSAMLGSRSGNRGMCAQPCRLPFCSGSFERCLSLKDMSYLSEISRLREIGVSSLKIEGRMKRPEYCAAAVTACRSAVDNGEVPKKLSDQLEAVFSRSGFTSGYLTARRGKSMFGYRTRSDVVSADSALLSSLHSLYKNEYSRVGLDISLISAGNGSFSLEVSDGVNTVTKKLTVPENSGLPELSADTVKEKLSKTGGTAYFAKNINCKVAPAVRVSEINALRRDALSELSQLRSARPHIEFTTPQPVSGSVHKVGKQQLRAVFLSPEQLPDVIPSEISKVYLPLETPAQTLSRLYDKLGERLALEAPRGMFGGEQALCAMLSQARDIGISECMVHNIGLVEPARELGLCVYGGFGLNITNTRALECYKKLGLSAAELSFELTRAQINRLGSELPRGITIYGYLPLMLCRNCPAALGGECGKKSGNCSITDRLGKTFPVRCRMGCSEVFNSIPVSIVEKSPDFDTVDHFFLRFTVENSVETAEIFNLAVNNSPLRNTDFTRGLYYRGVK